MFAYILKFVFWSLLQVFFEIPSNAVKCFQAVENISPLFSTTLKNYFRLSNNTAPLIIPPKIWSLN